MLLSASGTAPSTLSQDEDDRICLYLLHRHGIKSHKLEKLIDLSVNQVDVILDNYESTKAMPAQLAKAFLNGAFSGIIANKNELKQLALQIGSLQEVKDDVQTPDHFLHDGYLGKGSGINSRLEEMEKLKCEAKDNLEKMSRILHERKPQILKSIAGSIKKTYSEYNNLFCSLDKIVMNEVSDLVKDLVSTISGGGEDAKSLQAQSKDYPHLSDLSDPEDPLFIIPLMKDAQNAKTHLDAFVEYLVQDVNGAKLKTAPLKSVERAMAKVYEKYNCRFDMLTDLARATVICEDERALRNVLLALTKAVKGGTTRIVRIKFRLDELLDVMEAGGYRDILINMAFPEKKDYGHIVELQLNLRGFVEIKDEEGHSSYAVARMLQAFDPYALTYTGIASPDSTRDIETGLIKKATLVGCDVAETEVRMVKALGSRSVQLIELKLLNIQFKSDLGSLKWLVESAEHLAATLRELLINRCEVTGRIPPEIGLLCNLVSLEIVGNKIVGIIFFLNLLPQNW
jgi:hypothetical protein